ncbi:MAG: hypothetical protein WCJ42_01545 [Actinomycetes bacterium]
MRGSRVLLIGISALMATPIAIGVATSALGAQLAPQTSLLVTQAQVPSPATTDPVQTPVAASAPLSVTIPPVIFGTADGLPAKVTVGNWYQLAVQVWASLDTKNPVVTITYGTTTHHQVLVPGEITTIRVAVLGQADDVEVSVTSGTPNHFGLRTFAHKVA